MATAELNAIDAVLADGGLVHIRPLTDADRAKLHALNAASSDRSLYLRFFSMSRWSADNFADALVRRSSATYRALVASVGDDIVGVASFEAIDQRVADVALLVSDAHQHEGIGTLLLEHLASVARHHGLRRFRADVLVENFSMLRVFRDLGFRVTSAPDLEVIEVDLDLDPGPRLLEATDLRESSADIASMQPLLAPKSIAVIGAGARVNSVGHQVLRNIVDGGFTGSLQVVNPRHDVVLGIVAVPAATDLTTVPDLAIIAVPASQLLGVVRDCGERGVRGLLVLTAGFSETGPAGKDLQDEVSACARGYGMRMIGPNCLGVLNSDPAVRMNATFAPLPMGTGCLGLASQSGAFGIAVLLAAQRCGLGISQFVSIGNKADVSGNDLLLAWEKDPRTSVIALYLESLGNPRKFSRIARRVSRRKPIIAIKAGRSASGQRAGQSHTAAAASSEAVVEALFTEAGVLRVDTMAEMLDTARVLSDQPIPSGPRVAIIGNSGGPEILAADAAEAAGLSVVTLEASTTEQLSRTVPGAA
jgi:succinyl-CoA synthetase alpha subunit/RimJ/RimL family protein N-acetyltransferase